MGEQDADNRAWGARLNSGLMRHQERADGFSEGVRAGLQASRLESSARPNLPFCDRADALCDGMRCEGCDDQAQTAAARPHRGAPCSLGQGGRTKEGRKANEARLENEAYALLEAELSARLSEFMAGDLVRLKSGSPTLTIEEIRPNGDARVVWFAGDLLQAAAFPLSVLESI